MRKLAWGFCLALLPLLPITIHARNSHNSTQPVGAAFTVVNAAPQPVMASSSLPAKKTLISTPTPKAPGPYAELWSDTPVYTQGNLLNGVACAPTAVSMVMGHFAAAGLPSPTPAELIKLIGADKVVPGQGMPYNSMLPTLDGLGYHNLSGHMYTSSKELAEQLKSGPVIITAGVNLASGSLQPGKDSHSLVVIGVTTNGSHYTIQDPYLGQRIELPTETFNQIWAAGSYGIFVMRP